MAVNGTRDYKEYGFRMDELKESAKNLRGIPIKNKFRSSQEPAQRLQPLLPPFIQSKSLSDIFTIEEASQIREHTSHDSSSSCISGEERSEFSEKEASEPSTFERSYKHRAYQTESSKVGGEQYEYHDFYQQEESPDRYDLVELESSDVEKKDPLWWMSRCETHVPSTDEHELEGEEEEVESVDFENATEPYLAHELYIPYEEIPKPRYFYPSGHKVLYGAKTLPKRARSPVRNILPGQFDLEAAWNNWYDKQESDSMSKYLQLSTERMSQTVGLSMAKSVDFDTIISSIVLQAICEQVTLTIDLNVNVDVGGFVNIATVFALMELDNLDVDIEDDEQRRLTWEMRHFYPPDDDEFPVPGKIPGYRKILLTAYRSKFSRFFCPTMHCRHPWCYVSPAHQRGQTSTYTNIRNRIDELEPRTEKLTTYVADVKCTHSQNVSDKSYVSYKRRSRAISVPKVPLFQDAEDLFLNLVSFM